MELPRLVHDELLHKLDGPQEQHMAQVLHAAEVEIPTKDLKHHQFMSKNEHTPLLKASPSGHHVVVVDTDKVEE
ncbi:Multidrug/oligosaccharidyl-lipid/polysaccharide, partial [Globisporangium polare]